jgi:hypothetical protein
LKPVATSTEQSKTKPAHQRARRAQPLVMRMDGWQIAGNVVVVTDGGSALLDKVLSPPAANPPSPRSDAA